LTAHACDIKSITDDIIFTWRCTQKGENNRQRLRVIVKRVDMFAF
jgi:hypothetical protein